MKREIEKCGPAPAGQEATCVLIDASTSMFTTDWPPTRLAGVQEACIGWFYAKITKHPDDLAAVVIFHNEAQIILPLQQITSSQGTFTATVKGMVAGGGTEMVAGLAAAGEILIGVNMTPRPLLARAGVRWLANLIFDDVKAPTHISERSIATTESD